MSSNFGQIEPQTTQLAALERLRLKMGKWSLLFFSLVSSPEPKAHGELTSRAVVCVRVANHVTSDDHRVHGISDYKLLNSGNIFLDIFVYTCQN